MMQVKTEWISVTLAIPQRSGRYLLKKAMKRSIMPSNKAAQPDQARRLKQENQG